MEATISFKTKPFEILDREDRARRAIRYKKAIGRVDCNLRPQDHVHYNSDLFPGLLKRAYAKALKGWTWAYLDALPPCVKVQDGFMAVVTVTIELD